MRPRGCFAVLTAGAQSLTTRRLVIFISGILLLSTTLLLFTPNVLSDTDLSKLKIDVPDSVSHIKDKVYVPLVPSLFGPAVHEPPKPLINSTRSTESWFGSYRWLSNPFSSSIAKDDRIALPPQQDRCFVLTYHERTKDKEQAAIDDKMLLAWRRAWWALGFRPLIVGEGEAKQHGLYEKVYRDKLSLELQYEMMRWLAWSRTTGSGILTDHRVIPIGPHDDVTIAALRRCEFRYASKYKNFEQKLYSGDKDSVENILRYITSNPPQDVTVKTIEQAILPYKRSDELLHEDAYPASMADYTPKVVKEKYPNLKLNDLPTLVNAHLHSAFLTHYPEGISLLSPFGDELNAVHHNALVLATRIAACPTNNPLTESCPPNLPKCSPCKKAATIRSPQTYGNSTKTFLLGTVPHPLITIQMMNHEIDLVNDKQENSMRYIRRKGDRDPWLRKVTEEIIKRGIGNSPRLVAMKEAVATRPGLKFTSMWSTDKLEFQDVDWTLGFVIPTTGELKLELPNAEESQRKSLEAAQKMIRNSKGKLLGVVEGWNLGDTEAWKFVNAWMERKQAIRQQWTKSEKVYGLGLDKSEK